MKILTVTPATQAAIVAEARTVLCGGGVVVLPTDTVYGIAAHVARADAVARICTIKGRPTGKPIALLAADTAAVESFGAQLTPQARRLVRTFWPGALTLVVDCAGVSEGFRVPNHPTTRAVLAACGGVLRVTSANLSGAMPAISAAESLRDVGLEADLVIDDGPSPGGVPSSVVRMEGDRFALLRPGAISAEQLTAAAAGDEA